MNRLFLCGAEIELRAFGMLAKPSATELHPRPNFFFFLKRDPRTNTQFQYLPKFKTTSSLKDTAKNAKTSHTVGESI